MVIKNVNQSLIFTFLSIQIQWMVNLMAEFFFFFFFCFLLLFNKKNINYHEQHLEGD